MSVLKNAGYLAFLRGGARGHLLAAPEVQEELLHRVLHTDPLERSSVLLSPRHVLFNCWDTKTKPEFKRKRSQRLKKKNN